MGVSLSPAISQSPRGQLYGWLPLSNAYGISFTGKNMKNSDKNLSGKVMKEKLKSVKTVSSPFIHHSSFCESLGFSPSYLTFGVAKGKVWCDET